MKYVWLRKWTKRLHITDKITFEYITKDMIVCAYNRPYHLVGISNNIIYHDRRLKEIDIVHELCHYILPEASEREIREITEGLLYG